MSTRTFFTLMALVWLPYGLYCFWVPTALKSIAGIVPATPTATTELRAMYGGLQSAIGVLSLAALSRPGLVRPALVMLAFLVPGLAIARLGGVVLDGGLSAYTAVGLGFEVVTSAFAIMLLQRT